MTLVRRFSIGAILVGTALSIADLSTSPHHLATAYLAAVALVVTSTLGAFILGCVFAVSGADWAVPFRRCHEALAGALPLVLVLSVPLAVWPSTFYPWARNQVPGEGGLLRDPHYFARAPFTVRVALELVVLVVLEEVIRRRSIVAVSTSAPKRRKARGLSVVALVAIAYVGSLLIDDLFMSAMGAWSSDLYALYALVGGFSGAVGTLGVASVVLRDEIGTTPAHAGAQGRTMLTSVALWGYLAFALFLLIWIADLPEEVGFLLHRAYGPWRPLFVVLVFGHFVIPLVALLPKGPKRRLGFVAAMGVWLAAMHALDCYWQIVPIGARAPNLLDVGPSLAMAGLLTLTAIARFRRHPVLPEADPLLNRGLAYRSP